MAPSKCDQKKADIIHQIEIECMAITGRVKAEYELECLEVKGKYDAKREQAKNSLDQQELEELNEIKRLHEAKMEPIKVSNAQKLSEARELYQIAAPDAGLGPSASSETHSSPTLVTALAETSNMNSAASKRPLDDTQESGDETDTSIPAFDPEATEEAEHSPPPKKRQLRARTFLGVYRGSNFTLNENDDEDDEDYEDLDLAQNEDRDGVYEESDFTETENRAEGDDSSDGSFRDLRQVFKTFDGTSAHRTGRSNEPSTSPSKKKNHPCQNEHNEILEARDSACSFSRKTDSEAEGGDEDEAIHSGPASQALRRNSARHGRPEPGNLKISLSTWGRL